MENATLLALMGPTSAPSDLTALIEKTAPYHARLSALYLGPVPQLPAYASDAVPYAIPMVSAEWAEARAKMKTILETKQAEARKLLGEHGLTGEVATLCTEPAALDAPVAARALFADLCTVDDSLRDNPTVFDTVIYGLLFLAPATVLLNAVQHPQCLTPKNVFVAWDNSRQAARAVRAALPLLKLADEVTIASFDAKATRGADGEAPGADLAAWLSHHGCRVTVQEYATSGKKVSDAILDRAAEQTADLIIMGAYGRSRLNERIFGGTTRSMLAQQKIPVLMAH